MCPEYRDPSLKTERHWILDPKDRSSCLGAQNVMRRLEYLYDTTLNNIIYFFFFIDSPTKKSSSVMVYIQVLDLNDNAPELTYPFTPTVCENVVHEQVSEPGVGFGDAALRTFTISILLRSHCAPSPGVEK